MLEETELSRKAENIFTENVRFFILENEKHLRRLDGFWLFRDDRCYVIKWEYRIERIGRHKNFYIRTCNLRSIESVVWSFPFVSLSLW